MADRRKLLGAAALAAALAGGGVTGALLGAPDTSGAATEATADDGDDAARDDGRHDRIVLGGVDLEVAAEALGMTEDELEAALEEGGTIADLAEDRGVDVQAVIDALVEDGAADLRAALEERVSALVHGDLPFGPGGLHGPGGPRFHGLPGVAVDLEVAAEALGMTEDELRDALEDGRSIAEVAEERGVDRATVVDALVAAATERLDEAVEEGRLDEERADEIEEGLAERIQALVERDLEGPGVRWRIDGPGRGWLHGDDDGADEGAEDPAERTVVGGTPLRAAFA